MKNALKQLELSPEELRSMQLVQLEILVELERICNENNIKYCLGYGTLLGAIRHKGFIPWDDDVDVIILRSEYEKLFEVCKTELGKNFFLQDTNTDSNYRWGYAKIRRNGTEYIRSGQEHMHYKTGIFIDIFIMDNVSDNPFLMRFQNWACFALRKILWSEAGKVSEKSALLRIWYQILSCIPRNAIFSFYNAIIKRNNVKETKLVRSMLFQMFHKGEFGFKREWLTNLTKMEFEGSLFPVPTDYHGYLSFTYHNYMQPPSPDKRAGHAPVSTFQLPGRELLKV
jgi:lipopolysaccharide cholinephosphotransferase